MHQEVRHLFHDEQSIFPQIEDELFVCIMDLRKSGYAVCTEMLQLEGSKVAQKFNIPVTEFKTSYEWV
jgi:hypothetical protein